jgi:hypothetical protein
LNVNTNLTKEELTKLFSGAASKEEAGALVKKLKAEKISVPEIVFAQADGSTTARELLVSGVNEGKIVSAALKSVDGKGKAKGGEVTFKAGAIELRDLNMGTALAAAFSGNFGDGAMQIGKMSWAGFQVTAPDEDVKPDAPGGNLYKISLGAFTAEGTYDGEMPRAGKAEAKNIVVEPPKTSKMGQGLAAAGYDKITVGFTGAAAYDKAKRSYDFSDFTLNVANVGAVQIKALMNDLDPIAFTGTKEQKNAAYISASLGLLSIRYADAGIFNKAVGLVAQQQKKAPDALKKEWAAMATAMLPMVLGGDPAGQKLGAAIASFIDTPKTITITAKAKGAPVKLTEMPAFTNPSEALKRVDLDAVAGR